MDFVICSSESWFCGPAPTHMPLAQQHGWRCCSCSCLVWRLDQACAHRARDCLGRFATGNMRNLVLLSDRRASVAGASSIVSSTADSASGVTYCLSTDGTLRAVGINTGKVVPWLRWRGSDTRRMLTRRVPAAGFVGDGVVQRKREWLVQGALAW